MVKGNLFIIVIVLAWIVACTQTTEEEKTQLVASDVTKIEITSNGSEKPMDRNIKALNRSEIKRFVELWNSSKPAENCKFYPEYELRVFLKDGSHLTFKLNDKQIKENNETCYHLDYEKLVKLMPD